jgi:DNA-directed RNA polymerase specialized sigma24 family protein
MRCFPSANDALLAARAPRAGEVALDTASTLAGRARLGQREAFLELVRQEQDRVFRLAWLLFPDDASAAAAAIDAFVRAERSLRAARRPFFALVARELIRRARDARKRPSALRAPSALGAAKAGAEGTASVLMSLRALDVDDAATLALRFVLGARDVEAFAALGSSRREMERRTARALARFRAALGERRPSPPLREGSGGMDLREAIEALGSLALGGPPAPPDLLMRVRRRLEAPVRRPPLRPPRLPAIALVVLGAAAAGFGVAVGLLAASGAARDWLHVGPSGAAVAPSPAPSPTAVPTATPVAVTGFARPVTLEDARRLAPFVLMFPRGWEGPDAVYIWEPEPGNPVVILSYLDGGFDLYEGALAATFEAPPVELAHVQVDGSPARWLQGGAIVLHYIDVSGRPVVERKRIVDRNTLVWERSGVTLRMETSRALPFALAIAGAVR